MNERKTENIVRKYFSELGYYDDNDLLIEEQQSDNPRIKKLLRNASKKGSSQGYPEFIITSRKYSDFIIIIECKADITKHESKDHSQFAQYAVDGALLYATYLKKEYDVIAIAVSGETKKELKINHFLYLKNQEKEIPVFDGKLLSFSNYYSSYSGHQAKFNQDYVNLLKFSERLNRNLHTYKISEADRAFFISGVLIALQDKAFIKSYESESTAISLTDSLISTIKTQLTNSKIPDDKIKNIESQFLFIKGNIDFLNDKTTLVDLIKDIDREVNNFMKTYQYFDTLGRFYTEFLRYANNDSGLGIVLTPVHITELFCDLAEITTDSIVIDNCCGTGGFLISAMKRMIELALDDEKKVKQIKKEQIVGVEVKPNIYSLCVTNMIIHGDGKTNILHDSCFLSVDKVKSKYKPTIGFLNPPYKADKKADTEELEFVLNNLEMLEKNGLCVCIIPISCAIGQKGKLLALKKRLLKEHTLEAVMSMPDQLFYPVSVVSCIMIFTAKKPHPKGKKTWFGYWKEDGYVISRNKRLDINNQWVKIKTHWIDSFVNRETTPGESIAREVNASDEWCAEAYLETDFNKVKNEDFNHNIRRYITFKIENENIQKLLGYQIEDLSLKRISEKKLELKPTNWKAFSYSKLFDIYTEPFIPITAAASCPGDYPFISTGSINNGAACFTSIDEAKVYSAGCITVASSGSAGEAFYQPLEFKVTNMVIILKPKFKINIFIGLFIATIIGMEKYRYSYGRKAGKERLRDSIIKLPVDKDNNPDFSYMEQFIKSLPYSCGLL